MNAKCVHARGWPGCVFLAAGECGNPGGRIAVMGVDPGVAGGVAVLDQHGGVAFVRGLRSDMTEDEVLEILRFAATALLKCGGWECYFEKVQHMTGDGAQGSHTFGYIKGLMRGALKSRGVHLYDVPPQLWQTKLECMTGGNKNISKKRAVELFPGIKMTHAIADALLIATYGRMCAR
jgi:hypothetical protein